MKIINLYAVIISFWRAIDIMASWAIVLLTIYWAIIAGRLLNYLVFTAL